MRKIAFLSHSGGLDSSTLLVKLLHDGYDVFTFNFNYGQINAIELAKQSEFIKYAKTLNSKGKIIDTYDIDLNPLLDQISKNKVKTLQKEGVIKSETDHEYYFPFRNLSFATVLAMTAEIIIFNNKDEFKDCEVSIMLGLHKHSDVYSRDYWDITPNFKEKLNALIELNDSFKDIKFKVEAPYSEHYKSEIISDVVKYNIPYEKTITCYNPKAIKDTLHYEPCRECEACKERELAALNCVNWKNSPEEINNYII